MPRWYIDADTKKKLDIFNTQLSAALKKPTMDQENLMKLLMKHEEVILDVIVTGESVTKNAGPQKQVVPA